MACVNRAQPSGTSGASAGLRAQCPGEGRLLGLIEGGDSDACHHGPELRQKPNSAPLMIMSTPMNARRVQR